MTVACPKCGRDDRWHATGRYNDNLRLGVRRAELICDHCRYAFNSGIAEALDAAEAVSGRPAHLPPVPRQASLPES